MSYQVNLTYFKRGGKYYTTGEYFSEEENLFQIWDEVKNQQRHGRLPGLVDNAGKDFYILVEAPSHPHAHPKLLMPLLFFPYTEELD